MLIAAHDITDVTLRPVALFADLLRWSRISFSDLDRPIEIISEGVIKLLHAVDFCFEVRSRSGTNVTCDAVDIRMGGMLRGHKLRLHRQMTGLATELHRLRILIGLVAADGRHEQKESATENEQAKNRSITVTAQINLDNDWCRGAVGPPGSKAFYYRAGDCQA